MKSEDIGKKYQTIEEIKIVCPCCGETFALTKEMDWDLSGKMYENATRSMSNMIIRADTIMREMKGQGRGCKCGEGFTGYQDNLDEDTYHLSCKCGNEKEGNLSDLLFTLGLRREGERILYA